MFQFNQLHCDRPVSIGGMMLQPPSSILTLTPFEMWAVSNSRIDAVKMLPIRLETVKLKALFRLKVLREWFKKMIIIHIIITTVDKCLSLMLFIAMRFM